MSDTYSMEKPLTGSNRFWTGIFGRRPLSIRKEFLWFLGPNFASLETHEKTFPGYDLASIHRALSSFADELCFGHRELGACQADSIHGLFALLEQPWFRNSIPQPLTFQRVPIDVEEETSLANNLLSFAIMKPEAGRFPNRRRKSASVIEPQQTTTDDAAAPERIAILLAMSSAGGEYWDNLDGRNAMPQAVIKISIACRSKSVADRFFDEIEDRRKRLSIYRGKVIDPVVSGGGIHSIGFRPIQRVNEDHLILPEDVKTLIKSSILGFYKHREKLEELGIEMKRGILFHSPPGTGKTSISLYLAGLLPNFTICFVSGERLLYPREICRMARYLQPSMVVFEDIDLVAQDRNATGLATVLGELMNQIDGCEVTDLVLFIMNTNSLERLEHAVRNRPGRVDQIIAIPLPDESHRERLIRYFATPLFLDVPDMKTLLRATDGATPAMLKEIVKRAAVNALGEQDKREKSEKLHVTEADLLLATEQVRALRDPEPIPGMLGFREPR